MLQVDSIAALRAQLQAWRLAGEKIALVPTMGSLHAGHLALVEHAQQLADRVVVSIFVNPLQFGPNEDFDRYPRSLDADAQHLRQIKTDLLFAPPVAEVYPSGQASVTTIEVPGVSEGLCGAQRPGHFVGVATVVAKLFNMVQPDLAVFGEKDYQQLQVIRKMVADLCMPVEIVGMPTVREQDGLALSSRNQYLNSEERAKAVELYQELRRVADDLTQNSNFEAEEDGAMTRLKSAGFAPEYFAIRDADSLDLATEKSEELIILVAAKLGKTRLIDNLRLSLVK